MFLTSSGALNDEIKTFNENRAQDERQFKAKIRKFLQLNGDTSDSKYLNKLSEAVQKRITGSRQIQTIYSDILQLFLRFQLDSTVGLPKWMLLEKIMRQLAGNKTKITFDDYKYFSVKKLLKDIQNGISLAETLNVKQELLNTAEMETEVLKMETEHLQTEMEKLKTENNLSAQLAQQLQEQLYEAKRKADTKLKKEKEKIKEKLEKAADEKKNIQEMLRKQKETSARQVAELKKELKQKQKQIQTIWNQNLNFWKKKIPAFFMKITNFKKKIFPFKPHSKMNYAKK